MNPIDPAVCIEASRRIAAWARPLLLSHAKPDGDAIGSLLALRSLLRGRGADPLAVLFDPIPDNYAAVHRYEPLPILGRDVQLADLDQVDGIILLDTCTRTQLEPIADWLAASRLPKLAVDHHVNRDDLVDLYVVDPTAAATCLILLEWARQAGWTIEAVARDALYLGIATDTGWFSFSNTDARALAAAAELVGMGLKPHEWYCALFQQDTAARVRLLGEAIQSLDLRAENRLAIMTLHDAQFAASGAAPADTENIVNEPMRIESVAVAVLAVQHSAGPVRLSFRSKPPREPTHPDVDVSAVAQAFGGGGHRRAAGARVKGVLADVRRRVVEHIEQVLQSGE